MRLRHRRLPFLVEQRDSRACTGEDGLGRGWLKYLEAEPGPEAIDAMCAPKKAVDPQNIFDRDKIVPLRRSPRQRCCSSCFVHEAAAVSTECLRHCVVACRITVPIPSRFHHVGNQSQTFCGLTPLPEVPATRVERRATCRVES
ncbi:MAG: hypothetical protein KIT82_04810 [Bradyrhizobium sp.]|nr:hypothetical protein [Bradyrhizobium sp.]